MRLSSETLYSSSVVESHKKKPTKSFIIWLKKIVEARHGVPHLYSVHCGGWGRRMTSAISAWLLSCLECTVRSIRPSPLALTIWLPILPWSSLSLRNRNCVVGVTFDHLRAIPHNHFFSAPLSVLGFCYRFHLLQRKLLWWELSYTFLWPTQWDQRWMRFHKVTPLDEELQKAIASEKGRISRLHE